jgi:hypothetical protein
LNSQISWIDLIDKIDKFNQRIFSLFTTDIESILRNKFEWMDQKGINTLVVDSWFYWEYEQFIKYLNDKNKDESEQRKKQEESESGKYSNISGFNPSKMMSQFNPQNAMKNFGNMGNNTAFPRI